MNSYINSYKWRIVFDINNDQIWNISWLLLNLDNKKIIWIIFRKRFLNYGYIYFNKNNFLNEDIIIDNKDIFKDTLHYEILSKKVFNQEWIYLWEIFDVEFDVFFNLKNIYIDLWYKINKIKTKKRKIDNLFLKEFQKFSVKNIIEINKDYLIVQDINYLKENKKNLEKISNIFINIPNPSYNINLFNHE